MTKRIYKDRNEKQQAYRERVRQRKLEQKHSRVAIYNLNDAIIEAPKPEPSVSETVTDTSTDLVPTKELIEEIDYSNLSDKDLITLHRFVEAKVENEHLVRDKYGLWDEVEKRFKTWQCPECLQTNSNLDEYCSRCGLAKPGYTTETEDPEPDYYSEESQDHEEE